MNLQILHYPVVNASLVYLSVLYLYDMLLPTYYANFAAKDRDPVVKGIRVALL